MDLKEGLENLKKKPEEPEDNDPLTFEQFKRKVGDIILDDKILVQMKLKWYEDATQMIVFQGVRSNVIARLRSNSQHVINRSVFKKRIQEVLELEMEPTEDQKLAAKRKPIKGKGVLPEEPVGTVMKEGTDIRIPLNPEESQNQ